MWINSILLRLISCSCYPILLRIKQKIDLHLRRTKPVFLIRNSLDYAIIKHILPHLNNYALFAVTQKAKDYLRSICVPYREFVLFPSAIASTVFFEHDNSEKLSDQLTKNLIALFLKTRAIKKIQLYHGVLDKNYTFSPISDTYDLLLVPGKYFYDRLRKLGVPSSRIKLIGYLKFNNLSLSVFSTTPQRRVKNILYAPTWGAISSLPIMLNTLKRLKLNYDIRLKPHYLTPWYYIEAVKSLNISVIDNPDITESFTWADILISDSSSCMFEFLTTSKPVIAIDSLLWLKNTMSFHGANGPEIRFRNIFHCVSKPENILSKIRQIEISRNENSTKIQERKKILNYIFSDIRLPGKIAANEITRLLQQHH